MACGYTTRHRMSNTGADTHQYCTQVFEAVKLTPHQNRNGEAHSRHELCQVLRSARTGRPAAQHSRAPRSAQQAELVMASRRPSTPWHRPPHRPGVLPGGQVCGTGQVCPSGRDTWAGVPVLSPHPLAPPATPSRCPAGRAGVRCGAGVQGRGSIPEAKRRGLQRDVGRASRHSGELGQWTAMYSADELDLGMGTLSSRRPCRCISIAS